MTIVNVVILEMRNYYILYAIYVIWLVNKEIYVIEPMLICVLNVRMSM